MASRTGLWRVAGCVIWIGVVAGCPKGGSHATKDPCDPNPCKQVGKTTCDVVDKAVVCACDDGLVPDGRGGCGTTDSWSAGIAGNAVSSSAAPEYTAHVRVVDAEEAPIKDVTLRVGKRVLMTDIEGRGGFTKLPTGALSHMQIESDGFVPVVRQLSIVNAGMGELEVELVKEGKLQTFDAAVNTTLQTGNVGMMLPARGFVGASDGKRAQGSIKARITSFAPSALSGRAWPGDRQARNAAGAPTLVERWLGGVHARFEDAQGGTLQLGPGSTAKLSIGLPAEAMVAQGDKVGLWALDEASGLWLLESSCTVMVEGSGAMARKVCAGQVSHFSTWAAGVEWDIYKPGTLGCVNVSLNVKLPGGYAANTRRLQVMECKGADCSESVSWSEGQALYQYNEKWEAEAICGVTGARNDVRVMVQLEVAKTDPMASSGLRDGTYVYETEPVNLQSFKEKLGAEVMLNQTFEPAGDCELLCAQVAITLDENALKDSPFYADVDGDHYFTPAKGETLPWQLGRADCDDSDPRKHPYAFESGCGGVDYDCDGVIPPESQVSWHDVADPWLWNNRMCPVSCAIKDEKETTGNFYDEDCDGRVEDPDGDGYSWYGTPADCDESSAEAHPGGTEVPGNETDEDCDGIWLDYDGDGYLAWGHEFAAMDLVVDPEHQIKGFGDCNDNHSWIHPDQGPDREVGSLGRLFYRNSPDGRLARTEEFCSYFNADGKPNDSFYSRVIDYNCDGFVTDMDGDGFTDPRDTTLGAKAAYDCNDLDPRIHPEWPVTFDADRKAVCVKPPASQLIDDAICLVAGEALSEGCSPLPLEGQSVPTSCYKVPNTQIADLAYCIYQGWETGNPLQWKPGQPWGPCDGVGAMPDCPEGYQCGGQLKYSKELEAYLMAKYTENAPISYKGMCFKRCKAE